MNMRLAYPKRMHRRMVGQKRARQSNRGNTVKWGRSKSHSPWALQFVFRTYNVRIRIINQQRCQKAYRLHASLYFLWRNIKTTSIHLFFIEYILNLLYLFPSLSNENTISILDKPARRGSTLHRCPLLEVPATTQSKLQVRYTCNEISLHSFLKLMRAFRHDFSLTITNLLNTNHRTHHT